MSVSRFDANPGFRRLFSNQGRMHRGLGAWRLAAIYLAAAPKSNAVYTAYASAAADAHERVAEPVPLHLRNAPTRLMRSLDYGKGYRYAHDEPDAVTAMECLPAGLQGRRYYRPTERGHEREVGQRMAEREKLKQQREKP